LTEDPGTGSATAAMAALLADHDSMQDGEIKQIVGQGFDLGRPSVLLTRVRKKAAQSFQLTSVVGTLR
jgi:trans-2,3-dihydro-3-hydroxyanthranilate isomerase